MCEPSDSDLTAEMMSSYLKGGSHFKEGSH